MQPQLGRPRLRHQHLNGRGRVGGRRLGERPGGQHDVVGQTLGRGEGGVAEQGVFGIAGGGDRRRVEAVGVGLEVGGEDGDGQAQLRPAATAQVLIQWARGVPRHRPDPGADVVVEVGEGGLAGAVGAAAELLLQDAEVDRVGVEGHGHD